MTARMTWISHATTPLRGGAFPADEPLDARGRAASAAAAGVLRRADRNWTAPELRCVETAKALGLTAAVAQELRDCDLGRWGGRQLSEVEVEDPAGLVQWLTDPTAAPHGGESIAAVLQRVGAWFDAHGGDSGHSIVVAHPAVIRVAILHVLQAKAESFSRIDVGLLSQAIFTRAGAVWRFRRLGRLAQDGNVESDDG